MFVRVLVYVCVCLCVCQCVCVSTQADEEKKAVKRAILQANEILHEKQNTITSLAQERDLACQQTGVMLEEMDRERVHARH